MGGLLALTMLFTAGGDVSAAPSSAPASALATDAPFLFNFMGEPKAPLPWNPTTWDVIVHSADPRTFSQLEGMQAQHGADCAPPPATHFNTSYEGAVFICRNHLMTAINAHGYGEIVLTPDHMVDFSGGQTTISFNLSTLRTAIRDWVDIWVTPFDQNLVLPLDERVDLQGPPARAIHVRMDQASGGGTMFRAEVINNFQVTKLPYNASKTVEKLLAPSAALRTTFALTISPTHITFGAPALHYNWVDTSIKALGWSRGVVQLSQHSYNPTKRCIATATLSCLPNTWHWSNFYISNAVPFTLLRGNPQVVDGSPMTVTFPAPAPKSAFVRFAAIGAIEISLDAGKTWQPATQQAQSRHVVVHFASYWMPVPARTISIMLRGQKWLGHPWWIRDVAIWSASTPSTIVPNSAPKKPVAAPATAPRPAARLSLTALLNPVPISAGIILLATLAGAAYFIRRRRTRLDRN